MICTVCFVQLLDFCVFVCYRILFSKATVRACLSLVCLVQRPCQGQGSEPQGQGQGLDLQGQGQGQGLDPQGQGQGLDLQGLETKKEDKHNTRFFKTVSLMTTIFVMLLMHEWMIGQITELKLHTLAVITGRDYSYVRVELKNQEYTIVVSDFSAVVREGKITRRLAKLTKAYRCLLFSNNYLIKLAIQTRRIVHIRATDNTLILILYCDQLCTTANVIFIEEYQYYTWFFCRCCSSRCCSRRFRKHC